MLCKPRNHICFNGVRDLIGCPAMSRLISRAKRARLRLLDRAYRVGCRICIGHRGAPYLAGCSCSRTYTVARPFAIGNRLRSVYRCGCARSAPAVASVAGGEKRRTCAGRERGRGRTCAPPGQSACTTHSKSHRLYINIGRSFIQFPENRGLSVQGAKQSLKPICRRHLTLAPRLHSCTAMSLAPSRHAIRAIVILDIVVVSLHAPRLDGARKVCQVVDVEADDAHDPLFRPVELPPRSSSCPRRASAADPPPCGRR